MKPLACLIAVASGLWWSGAAVAQSRPTPPSSEPAAEIAQLRETLIKLTAATKELETRLVRLDQASRRSATPPAPGGGMTGGGFGGSFGGPGGGGVAFGGVARGGPQGGSRPRPDIHATAHSGPSSFRSPPMSRGEGRGPSPRGGRSVDEKLDRIMRELEQLRRELRHSNR